MKKKDSCMSNKELLKIKIREAYKTARTNIDLALMKDGCKKIAFVSSGLEVNKTKTTVNTAIAFAEQIDKKVLLVECDLRCPEVDHVLKLKQTPGLTDYLNRNCSLEEIIQDTENPNLKVVTCGMIPQNPSELLMSYAMTEFIDQVEAEFDYIIFSVPPIGIVIDTILILKLADGVVIVAKDRSTTYPEMEKMVQMIKETGTKILGVLLSGIEPKKRKNDHLIAEKYYGLKNDR